MSWAEAQASFSLGACSQGSGSPVAFMDAATCDDLIQDLRGDDGQLPDFDSLGSEPGSPPPALEAAVDHGERATQTHSVTTCDTSTDTGAPAVTPDASTQVLSRPHQRTSATQTPALASTTDQTTQVFLRPRQSWAYTQTERPATSVRTSWTRCHEQP